MVVSTYNVLEDYSKKSLGQDDWGNYDSHTQDGKTRSGWTPQSSKVACVPGAMVKEHNACIPKALSPRVKPLPDKSFHL